MIKKQETPKTFDWENYGEIVYRNLEQFRADIERIRDTLEELERNGSRPVGTMEEQLKTMKADIETLKKKVDEVQKDFNTCRLESVKTGGLDKTEVALLAQEVKRHNTGRSVLISFVFTVIGGIIIVVITHFINHK